MMKFSPDVSVAVSLHRKLLVTQVRIVVGVVEELPAFQGRRSPGLADLEAKLLSLVQLT